MPKILYILLVVHLGWNCTDSKPEETEKALVESPSAGALKEGIQAATDIPESAKSTAIPDAASPPVSSKPSTRAESALSALLISMDDFFRNNVKPDGLDYAALAAAPHTLQTLVESIASISLQSASPPQIQAFQINAYNLLAIQQVLRHYPIASPLDVPGFFKDPDFEVAGQITSLDGLESPLRNDPRTHFALVCAARGCPALQPRAYLPQTLDAQLDEAARSAVNDPQWLRHSPGSNQVSLSMILKWYAQDFGGEDALVTYLNRYRETALPPHVAIAFYPYDWALNNTAIPGR